MEDPLSTSETQHHKSWKTCTITQDCRAKQIWRTHSDNGDTTNSKNNSIGNDGDTSDDESDENDWSDDSDGSDDQFSDEAFD
jgi:hypothetical protein